MLIKRQGSVMVHPSPGQLCLTRANKNTHKELYTRDSRDRPLDKKKSLYARTTLDESHYFLSHHISAQNDVYDNVNVYAFANREPHSLLRGLRRSNSTFRHFFFLLYFSAFTRSLYSCVDAVW